MWSPEPEGGTTPAAFATIMLTVTPIEPTPAPLMVTVLVKVPAALPTGSVFTQIWKVCMFGLAWNGPAENDGFPPTSGNPKIFAAAPELNGKLLGAPTAGPRNTAGACCSATNWAENGAMLT